MPSTLDIIAAEARAGRTVIVGLRAEDQRRKTWEIEPYGLEPGPLSATLICCRVAALETDDDPDAGVGASDAGVPEPADSAPGGDPGLTDSDRAPTIRIALSDVISARASGRSFVPRRSVEF